ncbi:MAG: hypothetical protein V1811_02725 [Candidatus Micrarchaeota archaeon]
MESKIIIAMLLFASFAVAQQEALFLSFELNETSARLSGYAVGKATVPDYALEQPPGESLVIKTFYEKRLLNEFKVQDPRDVVIEYYDNDTQRLVANHTRLKQATLQLVLPSGNADNVSLFDSRGNYLASVDLISLNLAKAKTSEFDFFHIEFDPTRDVLFWTGIIVLILGVLLYFLKKRGETQAY